MTTPEPVGPEFGLEPTRDTALIRPPIDSHSVVSAENYRTGSEFLGVDGLIQPPPHVPTAGERLHMIYAIDPMDDGTRADSVQPPEFTGDFT